MQTCPRGARGCLALFQTRLSRGRGLACTRGGSALGSWPRLVLQHCLADRPLTSPRDCCPVMESLVQSLEQVALNPAYHDVFTVAKAARNGAVYGAKIRFPHALVMTFLFGRGTPRDKLKFVYKATRQHSTNLMKFASLYKLGIILMRRSNGGKERSGDSFLAGCLAGWFVFGERNAVNEQVRPDAAGLCMTPCSPCSPDCSLLYCALCQCDAAQGARLGVVPAHKANPDREEDVCPVCGTRVGECHVAVQEQKTEPAGGARQQHGLYVARGGLGKRVLTLPLLSLPSPPSHPSQICTSMRRSGRSECSERGQGELTRSGLTVALSLAACGHSSGTTRRVESR